MLAQKFELLQQHFASALTHNQLETVCICINQIITRFASIQVAAPGESLQERNERVHSVLTNEFLHEETNPTEENCESLWQTAPSQLMSLADILVDRSRAPSMYN
jgi:hypothetical protein